MGDHAVIYIDGACSFNGTDYAKAGVGIWWGDNHPNNISQPIYGHQTSNRAEIFAAIIGINQAAKLNYDSVTVCTDSIVRTWGTKWQKNGWKTCYGNPIRNKYDFIRLFKVISKINVEWIKVKAHCGIYGNEAADRLAKQGVRDYDSDE